MNDGRVFFTTNLLKARVQVLFPVISRDGCIATQLSPNHCSKLSSCDPLRSNNLLKLARRCKKPVHICVFERRMQERHHQDPSLRNHPRRRRPRVEQCDECSEPSAILECVVGLRSSQPDLGATLSSGIFR
jgi:hypothetical protein